jgi:hypothetical protein
LNNSDESIKDNNVGCGKEVCHELARVARRLKQAMDFSVVKEPTFVIFTAIDCVLSLTTTNVFLALPFYTLERKFSPLVAASFLSTISISEVVGGFLIPPLFDVKWINYIYIFSGLQLLSAGLFVGMYRSISNFEYHVRMVYNYDLIHFLTLIDQVKFNIRDIQVELSSVDKMAKSGILIKSKLKVSNNISEVMWLGITSSDPAHMIYSNNKDSTKSNSNIPQFCIKIWSVPTILEPNVLLKKIQ